MLDEATAKIIMQVLERELDTKKRAIMTAIDCDHDAVLPQHIKDYRTVLHAKEAFHRHLGSVKVVKE